MENLNEKLLAVVRQNLPEQVAKEMKEFIEAAEVNAKALKETQGLLNLQAPLLLERTKLINEKNAVEAKESANLLKERELNQKELALQLKEKELQINALTEIKNNMFTVMQLFVKNPRAIEIMAYNDFGSINKSDQYGSTRETSNSNSWGSEAKEKIQTKETPNLGSVSLPEQE